MGSKGSQQTTNSSSSSSPPPQVMADYQALVNRSTNQANIPYEQYPGELVAPLSGQTQQGLGQLSSFSQAAQPFYNAAALGTVGAAEPVSSADISQYQNPYTQSVVDATQKEFNNQNTQQDQFLNSQNISSGAFGGDRAGVSQAILANQQQTAQAPVIAGLYNQAYNQALTEANTQQSQLGAMSNQLGNLGAGAQTAGVQGGMAQLQGGLIPQQQQQAIDTSLYNQYMQQQAYPFQTTGWLGNIIEGTGSLSGGTSAGTSTTTSQSGSPISQGIGALSSSLGILGSLSDIRAKEDVRPIGKTFDGQTIYRFRYKGDPRTQVGLIAQETEHRHPHAVGHDGRGFKTVDYREATDDAAARGHFSMGGPALFGGRQGRDGGGAIADYTDDPMGLNQFGQQTVDPQTGIANNLYSQVTANSPNPAYSIDTGLAADIGGATLQNLGTFYDQKPGQEQNYPAIDWQNPLTNFQTAGAEASLAGLESIPGVQTGSTESNPPTNPTVTPGAGFQPWYGGGTAAGAGAGTTAGAGSAPGVSGLSPALVSELGAFGNAASKGPSGLAAWNALGQPTGAGPTPAPGVPASNPNAIVNPPRAAPPVATPTPTPAPAPVIMQPKPDPLPFYDPPGYWPHQWRGGPVGRAYRAAGGMLGQSGIGAALAQPPAGSMVALPGASSNPGFGSLFGNRQTFQSGGAPSSDAIGPPAYESVESWVPQVSLSISGHGPPTGGFPYSGGGGGGGGGGSGQQQQGSSGSKSSNPIAGLQNIGNQIGSLFSGSATATGPDTIGGIYGPSDFNESADFGSDSEFGAGSPSDFGDIPPDVGLGIIGGLARGGRIRRHFDDGGSVDPDLLAAEAAAQGTPAPGRSQIALLGNAPPPSNAMPPPMITPINAPASATPSPNIPPMSPAGGPWVESGGKSYGSDAQGQIQPNMIRPQGAPAAPRVAPAQTPGGFDPSAYPTNRADATPAQRDAFNRAYAASIGVDPRTVTGVAMAEGLNVGGAGPSRVDIDPQTGQPFSYGDFQENIRNGLGTEALQKGINPADPNDWQRANMFAIDQMKSGGLGPWKGDAYVKGLAAQGGGTGAPAGSWGDVPAPHAQAVQAAMQQGGVPPDYFAPRDFSDPNSSKREFFNALTYAGFAMMGGESRNPFINIGRGAMAGMDYMRTQQQYERDWMQKQAEIQHLSVQDRVAGGELQLRQQQQSLEMMMIKGRINAADADAAIDRQDSQVGGTAIPLGARPQPAPPPFVAPGPSGATAPTAAGPMTGNARAGAPMQLPSAPPRAAAPVPNAPIAAVPNTPAAAGPAGISGHEARQPAGLPAGALPGGAGPSAAPGAPIAAGAPPMPAQGATQAAPSNFWDKVQMEDDPRHWEKLALNADRRAAWDPNARNQAAVYRGRAAEALNAKEVTLRPEFGGARTLVPGVAEAASGLASATEMGSGSGRAAVTPIEPFVQQADGTWVKTRVMDPTQIAEVGTQGTFNGRPAQMNEPPALAAQTAGAEARARNLAETGQDVVAGQARLAGQKEQATIGAKQLGEEDDNANNQSISLNTQDQRLDALTQIMQRWTPGAWKDHLADIANVAKTFGIPIKDPSDAYEFVKNTTGEVFDALKEQKGQVRNMEISGLSRANPSIDIPPAANAAMIAQMKGTIHMRQQFYQDYNAWRQTPEGRAALNPSDFTVAWTKQHPIQPFVDAARKDISYRGQEIPPAGKREDGQLYMLQDGSLGRYHAGKGFAIEKAAQ